MLSKISRGRRHLVGSCVALLALRSTGTSSTAPQHVTSNAAASPLNVYDINIDLTAMTHIIMTPEIFGFATAAMMNDGCRICTNQKFQQQFAKLDPTLLRCNSSAGHGGATSENYWLCSIFPNSSPTNPQWKWIDALLDNLAKFMPNGRLVLDIGYHEDQNISPAALASMAQQLARHCIAKGVECFYWEVWNEANEPPGNISVQKYNAWFNAVADALHLVNPAYKIGGPVSSWSLAFGPEWAEACGARAGFIDFHGYPYSNSSATDYQMFTTKRSANDMTTARSAVRGTRAANLPLGYLEWSSVFSEPGDPRMHQTHGAIFAATYLANAAKANQGLEMAGIWEVYGDGNYGVIADTSFQIFPVGWYLGYAGRNVAGAVVNSDATVSRSLDVLATVNGDKFAVQIVNSGGKSLQVRSIGIKAANAVGPALTRWEISPSHRDPAISIISLDSLASGNGITIPALSVVIFTGSCF